MRRQFLTFLAIVFSALALFGLLAWADVPTGYPADYKRLVLQAAGEGRLVVYATTDTELVTELIAGFEAAYPAVKVEYHKLNSTELYHRYINETAAGRPSADVLWSSAMDLQVKLVNDGYALAYRSPEVRRLPNWAQWRDEAYGTTFEPIAFVYNKKKVPEKDVPHTHTELLRLLQTQRDKYRGKVVTYDAERSGLGYLLVAQDNKLNPDFWGLVGAMRACEVALHTSTGDMIDRISRGEDFIGYNMLGSYALARAKSDPVVGVVLPRDYTLVISRLMFISRRAEHPNAAKLWLDYVLSRRGQSILASQAELYSVRKDIEGKGAGATLSRELGAAVKPVTVGPGLLVYLDQAKHAEFVKQWRQALGNR